MGDEIAMVIKIGVAVFVFLLLALVALLIAPTMEGTGDTIADEMGTNLTSTYNATVATSAGTATTMGSLFDILPYVAVAFGFIAIVFGRGFIKKVLTGKVYTG